MDPDHSSSESFADQKARLLIGISKLNEQQGLFVVLHYLQEESLEDIARRLDLSKNEISSLHHEALMALKEYVTEPGKAPFKVPFIRNGINRLLGLALGPISIAISEAADVFSLA